MKTLLNLYVDADLKELAKQNRMNMSKFFNTVLEVELNGVTDNPKDEIIQLKIKLAKLTTALEQANKTIENMKTEGLRKNAKSTIIN